jgi:hypothetical protein
MTQDQACELPGPSSGPLTVVTPSPRTPGSEHDKFGMKSLVSTLELGVTPKLHDGPMTRGTTLEDPEQLSLLPDTTLPLRFRLDAATRRRGLRHIAEIRAQLESRAA